MADFRWLFVGKISVLWKDHSQQREQPEFNTSVDLAAIFGSLSTDPDGARLFCTRLILFNSANAATVSSRPRQNALARSPSSPTAPLVQSGAQPHGPPGDTRKRRDEHDALVFLDGADGFPRNLFRRRAKPSREGRGSLASVPIDRFLQHGVHTNLGHNSVTLKFSRPGKGTIKWTLLPCRSFAANSARLPLHALA